MGGYKNHRAIVEKALGRKLTKEEIIHHKDHNPENNDLANLEVVSRREHNIELFKGKNRLYKYRRHLNSL
jgi:hypothetical protein